MSCLQLGGGVYFDEVGSTEVTGGIKVGGRQGAPETSHLSAESEQLSTWPFGERQSLFWELSQVPGGRGSMLMLNNLSSRTVTGAEIRLFIYSHLMVFIDLFRKQAKLMSKC